MKYAILIVLAVVLGVYLVSGVKASVNGKAIQVSGHSQLLQIE